MSMNRPEPDRPASAMPRPTSGTPTTSTTGAQSPEQDSLKAQAGQVAQQAQDKASDVLDQAREQATHRLQGGKDRAVDGLDNVVHAVRQTGQQLRQSGHGGADYAERAADQAERLAGYLRDRDVDQLLDDAERFARQQPGLFLAGGLALGLLAARFLKSSERRMQRDTRYGSGMGSASSGWTPQYGAMPGYNRPTASSSAPSYASTGYSSTPPHTMMGNPSPTPGQATSPGYSAAPSYSGSAGGSSQGMAGGFPAVPDPAAPDSYRSGQPAHHQEGDHDAYERRGPAGGTER